VKIRNVIHKGLRRFILNDDDAGLPAAVVSKVGKIVSFLQDMEEEGELRTVPTWKTHQMTGDRKSTWSLFVTRNWRITFRIDKAEIQIIDLDYEDHH
jgi:proteic killer suppression protein